MIAEIPFALDKQDSQRLDAACSYPQGIAGGLMNVDVVTVHESVTLEVVLRYLKRRSELPENTNPLFVVLGRNDRLVGALPVSRLLSADFSLRVLQIMERDFLRFGALSPDCDVTAAFERYNLVSTPVVDEHHRLLERIAVDDIMDVIREEAEHVLLAPLPAWARGKTFSRRRCAPAIANRYGEVSI